MIENLYKIIKTEIKIINENCDENENLEGHSIDSDCNRTKNFPFTPKSLLHHLPSTSQPPAGTEIALFILLNAKSSSSNQRKC